MRFKNDRRKDTMHFWGLIMRKKVGIASVTTFLVLYCSMVLLLAPLRFYELYELSSSGYFIIVLYVFAFILSYWVSIISATSSFDIDGESLSAQIGKFRNNRKLIYLGLVTLLLSIYYAFRFLAVYDGENAADLRRARFEVGIVFTSQFELLVFEIVFVNLVWFYKMYLAACLGTSAKFGKVGAIALMIFSINFIIGGGRGQLVDLLIMSTFAVLTIRDNKKSFNINKLLVVALTLLGITLYLTAIRNGGDELTISKALTDQLAHLYVYWFGALRSFDHIVSNGTTLPMGYGIYTLSGVEELVALVLRGVGFDFLPFKNTWGAQLSEYIIIGDNVEINALYSSLFNFYMDLGIFGIVCAAFAIGYIFARSLINIKKYMNIYAWMVSALIFLQVCLFPVTWIFSSGNIILLLAVLYLIARVKHK